jgi:hypothetical protein
VFARVGTLRTLVAEHAVPAGPVILAARTIPVTSWDPRNGPDTVSLGIEDIDGTFTSLAELDGRYLSTEVAGGFTGRVLGAYAASGTVHVDWFDYSSIEETA